MRHRNGIRENAGLKRFQEMNINVVPANGMVQAEAKAVKGKVRRRG
jgi:hypothetical protein